MKLITGKSMVAREIRKQCDSYPRKIPFFFVAGSNILESRPGQSEQNIVELFKTATVLLHYSLHLLNFMTNETERMHERDSNCNYIIL